jgi:predicted Rdx family selenoprotein
LAEKLEARFGGKVALLEGAKGEFTVWLGDSLVAEKRDGMFPQAGEVLDMMDAAVGSSSK